MTEQPPADPGQQGNPGQQIDWEARYKGSVTKINELQGTIKNLTDQLAGKTSELEQSASQLNLKQVEKDAALNAAQKQLQELVGSKTTLESEMKELRAIKVKLDLARELNRPDLLPILDKIPFVEDPNAMREILKSFTGWADSLLLQREKQLTTGIPVGASVPQTPAEIVLPNTTQGWESYINSLPIGSKERGTAMDAFWKWGLAQK